MAKFDRSAAEKVVVKAANTGHIKVESILSALPHEPTRRVSVVANVAIGSPLVYHWKDRAYHLVRLNKVIDGIEYSDRIRVIRDDGAEQIVSCVVVNHECTTPVAVTDA